MAARNENYETILKPNLKNKVVLLDRFKDSTMAYQHYGFKLNKNIIKILNKFVIGKLKPDFTFLHVVPEKYIKKIYLEQETDMINLIKIFIKMYKRVF